MLKIQNSQFITNYTVWIETCLSRLCPKLTEDVECVYGQLAPLLVKQEQTQPARGEAQRCFFFVNRFSKATYEMFCEFFILFLIESNVFYIKTYLSDQVAQYVQ